MKRHNWVDEFPAAITVCDSAGVILELNKEAVQLLRSQGGRKLIGSNLADCHPPSALTKLRRLMKYRETNVYTVRKRRNRKIVLQIPWYRGGRYRGFVELDLPIRGPVRNVIRKP